MKHIQLVKKYWEYFKQKDYTKACDLLDHNVTILWPNTSESFNRSEFISINKNYPGSWVITIEKLIPINRNEVVTIAKIKSKKDIRIEAKAVSFFKIRRNAIIALTEYWGDIAKPPRWRKKLLSKARRCQD
ncbi:MAG: hypothetical protein M1561_03945 [Gammaproteobacteria bacterium]|nr:hypothetical protein [Gammaproteobacteria bacterium]